MAKEMFSFTSHSKSMSMINPELWHPLRSFSPCDSCLCQQTPLKMSVFSQVDSAQRNCGLLSLSDLFWFAHCLLGHPPWSAPGFLPPAYLYLGDREKAIGELPDSGTFNYSFHQYECQFSHLVKASTDIRPQQSCKN